MIMKAEMAGAKNECSIDAKMFEKNQNTLCPLSHISDLSDEARISVDVSTFSR
jgi:hypothetical protein